MVDDKSTINQNVKSILKKEAEKLYLEGERIAQALKNNDEIDFRLEYQLWYTQSLKVVEVLASDRYLEFRAYYEIDPKRKSFGYGTYVIQDYVKGVVPSAYNNFNSKQQALKCFINQLNIFASLLTRIDGTLANIEGEIYSELQDAELITARQLLKINIRAAGSLAGVIIETYLQKVAKHHNIKITKKNPTIGDLNDPLKTAGIINVPTWRKISYLADIRNLCAHKKDVEPSKEQVEELIEGANWLIKNIY